MIRISEFSYHEFKSSLKAIEAWKQKFPIMSHQRLRKSCFKSKCLKPMVLLRNYQGHRAKKMQKENYQKPANRLN